MSNDEHGGRVVERARGIPSLRHWSFVIGHSANWSNPWVHSVLVFAAALLVRLAFLAEILPHPYLDINQVRGTDMEGYLRWGWRIAQGNWLGVGEGPFYQGPAFPYLLGLTFALFGFTLLPALLLQAVLGSLVPVLIYWIGRRLFGGRVGLLAGLLAALSGMPVFFGVVLHSTTLEVFLVSGALLLLVVACEKGRGWWAWAGAAAALAALARPNLLIVPPFVVLALFLRGGDRRAAARAAGLFVLGFTLVIVPVTIRNVLVGGQFVVVSSAGPETFRITNSYDSAVLNFRYPTLPQMPVASWAFWKHQGAKAALFWWGFEAPQNVNFYLVQGFSWVLSLPLVASWALIPLAAVGGWLVRRQWRDLLPVLLFGLGYYLSVVAFHIVGRFRLPLMPILAVLAAVALARGIEGCRARDWGRLLAGAAVALALMGAVYPWSAWGIPRVFPVDHANYGYILANRGALAAGVAELAQAEAGLPGYPGLNYDMGRILMQLGQPREALARFERELGFDPRHAEAARRAGLAAKATGESSRAREHFQRYLLLAPAGPRADEVRRELVVLEGY
jgi:4-amino-4-deoxy-L-arabinose transferase-like glycosyltransferase